MTRNELRNKIHLSHFATSTIYRQRNVKASEHISREFFSTLGMAYSWFIFGFPEAEHPVYRDQQNRRKLTTIFSISDEKDSQNILCMYTRRLSCLMHIDVIDDFFLNSCIAHAKPL